MTALPAAHTTASLREFVDMQTLVDTASTPAHRLALVVLHTRFVSNVTRRPVDGAVCALPLFIDVDWPVRRLVQLLHTQTEHAHTMDPKARCVCSLRVATSTCFYADAASGNPLLPITTQAVNTIDVALCIGRTPPLPTADGSRASPNADPLFDASVVDLLRQRYLEALPSDSANREAARSFAQRNAHAPLMCVRAIAESRYLPSVTCRPMQCNTRQRCCACTICLCNRLGACIESYRASAAEHCTHTAGCSCLFEAALRRTSRIVHLYAQPAQFDIMSEAFGEHVFTLTSPTVRTFISSLGAHGTAILQRFDTMRTTVSAPHRLVVDPLLTRRLTLADLPYDRLLETLRAHFASDATTIAQFVVRTRRHTKRDTLERADAWFAEPARHYLRVALSGFADYSRRFELAQGAGVSAASERAIYAELAREPNRVLAVNRLIAFEIGAPSVAKPGALSLTSAQHDAVVNYVMLLAHIVELGEWAAAAALNTDPLRRFELLVSEALRRRVTDSPPAQWTRAVAQC